MEVWSLFDFVLEPCCLPSNNTELWFRSCSRRHPLNSLRPLSSSDLGWATFCSLTSNPEKSRMPTCMTRTPSRSMTRATLSTNGGERRARRSWRRRRPRGEVVWSKVRPRHLTQRDWSYSILPVRFSVASKRALIGLPARTSGSKTQVSDPWDVRWRGLSVWNISKRTAIRLSSRLDDSWFNGGHGGLLTFLCLSLFCHLSGASVWAK